MSEGGGKVAEGRTERGCVAREGDEMRVSVPRRAKLKEGKEGVKLSQQTVSVPTERKLRQKYWNKLAFYRSSTNISRTKNI